jgi:hypothetical protein
MAGVWFLAGLASVWNGAEKSRKPADLAGWISAGAVTAAVALMFSGMGLVRIPMRPVSDDAYRYVREIEKEFQGQPANKILLDGGTWVYARDRVIMGDRVAAVNMLADSSSDVAFSAFLTRIAAKRYSKILVRNLHGPDFRYENSHWPKPGAIRKALLDNYRETGHIRAAIGPSGIIKWTDDPYQFGEIAILEPKIDSPEM